VKQIQYDLLHSLGLSCILLQSEYDISKLEKTRHLNLALTGYD